MFCRHWFDYVFDGTATTPYREDAALQPVSAYGRTKAAGERLALEANPGRTHIVRAAWLYGAHGPNFAKTMLRLASERDEITVVDDQVGQPTWTLDLARQIVALLDSKAPAGTYHATNSGQASWFEFARAIFKAAGLDPARVKPTDSSRFVRPAPRPAYSVLGHDAWRRAGLTPMRSWDEALALRLRRRGSGMTTLRVIVDQIVAPVPGGIGRYAEELTRELINTAPAGCDVEGIVSASPESDYETIGRCCQGLRAFISPRWHGENSHSPGSTGCPCRARGWCTRRAFWHRLDATTGCTTAATRPWSPSTMLCRGLTRDPH